MRAAIYARYSSDLQRDRSIDDQVRNCQRFALGRNWIVLDGHIYTDYAISGASTIGRTGLHNLMREAARKPRPFDYILIDDTSRLSRKMGEVISIIEQLKFEGVNIFFVSQGIDSNDKQSPLTVGINSLIDGQYRRDLASKTLRGMAGQAIRGYNTGSRLYGYDYFKEFDPTGAIDHKTGQVKVIGTKIERNPEQEKVVREIFQMYLAGVSPADITVYLNDRGYPPPGIGMQRIKGKIKFTWIPNTVRSILQNPKYMGDWTFNRRGWIVNPETGQRRSIEKDIAEQTIVERPDLAIIDKDTWSQVQRIIETRRHFPQRKRGPLPKFLFSGLMKCHECGGSYVVVSGTNGHNPKFGCCTNKQRGKAACSNNFRVAKDEIENVILADIQQNLLSPRMLSAIINKVNVKLKAVTSTFKTQVGQIASERRKLEKRLANLINAIENGTYSDVIKKRIMLVEDQLRELNQKSEAFESDANFDRLTIDEDYVRGWLENIRALLETNIIKARTELMSLIGRFTLEPEIIDEIKCLRVRGEVNIGALLAIAAGQDKLNLQYMKILGERLELSTTRSTI